MVIGNWKMNPQTEKEALDLARGVSNQLGEVGLPQVEVGIAPPFVFLEKVAGVIENTSILLGAQDVFWKKNGAYTGEVSIKELRSVGVDFVIIGHSERRKMGETDEEINEKVVTSLKGNFVTILCVGETKEARGRGIDSAKEFVASELRKDLEGVDGLLEKNAENLVIAYEPRWAISTEEGSQPAAPEKAVEMISFIKKFLKTKKVIPSGEVRIIYGGSVNSTNALSFFAKDEIEGALVGSASLECREFVSIVDSSIIK